MKNLKKSFFYVLAILTLSCSSNNDSLTKEYILEYLKQYEVENPNQFKINFPNSFIKSKDELKNTNEYYKKLYNDGFIEAALRTDIPNAINGIRPYKVVTTSKAGPYILERNVNGKVFVKTLEFKAMKVNEIRILSDFKAEADVVFSKNKTPFHGLANADISSSGKEYKLDLVVKTISFWKNKETNKWFLPVKISF